MTNSFAVVLVCIVPFAQAIEVSAALAKDFDWRILVSDDTLALFFKDTRAGTLYNTCGVDSIKKVVTAGVHLEISSESGVSGSFSKMDLDETRTYDFQGNLTGASQRLKSASGTAVWEVALEKTGKWLYTVSVGGEEKKQYVPRVTENLKTSYEIQRAIKNRSIKAGDSWQDTLFELTAATDFLVVTKCIATPDKSNPRYVFINHDNLINRDERWEIDTGGRLAVQEVPPIFVARRYGPDTEKINEKAGAIDLYALFVIPADRPQKSAETIALSLKSGATMHESVQRFYRFENGKYREKNFNRKCSGSKKTLEQFDKKEEWLSSTVTIQSNNAEILKLADSLKGNTKNRCEIINRFNDYLYENIEKKHTATFSNAYETLKAGYGDCGEHAVLLAALLRAAGIESNVVMGLVYHEKGYYFHSWVAVYAGRLLFADPALGRFPATEGYVPLVIDNDGSKLVHLAGLIDRIEISYVPKESDQ